MYIAEIGIDTLCDDKNDILTQYISIEKMLGKKKNRRQIRDIRMKNISRYTEESYRVSIFTV